MLYKRVLLKISGEALKGSREHGYDAGAVADIVARIKQALDSGVEIALVVGAGNIWRGLAGAKTGMDRVTADHMGMLATVMNALCLKDAFTAAAVPCSVHCAVNMEPFAKKFDRDLAMQELSEGKLVIFAGGTSCPYFTTDTTAALRALEIKAQAVVKATKVNGIYTADPVKNPDAIRYTKLTYDQVLAQHLRATDLTAMTLALDNDMTLVCFGLDEENSIIRVVCGEQIGTTVKNIFEEE